VYAFDFVSVATGRVKPTVEELTDPSGRFLKKSVNVSWRGWFQCSRINRGIVSVQARQCGWSAGLLSSDSIRHFLFCKVS